MSQTRQTPAQSLGTFDQQIEARFAKVRRAQQGLLQKRAVAQSTVERCQVDFSRDEAHAAEVFGTSDLAELTKEKERRREVALDRLRSAEQTVEGFEAAYQKAVDGSVVETAGGDA